MPELSDADKLEQGWVLHVCGNVIPPEQVHCKYCKRFNAATNAEHCSLCGQKLPKKE